MKPMSALHRLGRETKRALAIVLVLFMVMTSFAAMAEYSEDTDPERNLADDENDDSRYGDSSDPAGDWGDDRDSRTRPGGRPGNDRINDDEREDYCDDDPGCPDERRRNDAGGDPARSAEMRKLYAEHEELSATLERMRHHLRELEQEKKELYQRLRGAGDVERERGEARLKELEREINVLGGEIEEIEGQLQRIGNAIRNHEKEERQRDKECDKDGNRRREDGRPVPGRPGHREMTPEEKIRHLRFMILEHEKRINMLENRILSLEQKLLYTENEDARWMIEIEIGLLEREIEGEYTKIEYLEEQIEELEECEPSHPFHELFMAAEVFAAHDDGIENDVELVVFMMTEDGEHFPAEGAFVYIDGIYWEGETDEEGTVFMDDLPSGDYLAHAELGDMETRTEFFIDDEPWEPELTVTYDVFRPEGRDDFAVKIVAYYGDRPAANAEVWLSSNETGHTNQYGIVYFDGLGAGEYTAAVEYEGSAVTITFFIEEEQQPELIVEYEIFDHGENGYVVKIIAHYGDRPAVGAEVALSNDETGYTNYYGFVLFDGLEPGEYHAVVEYEGMAVTIEFLIE